MSRAGASPIRAAIRPLAVATAFAALTALGVPRLELRWTVTEERQGATAVTEIVSVTLGADRTLVRRPASSRVYDFSTRRILSAGPDGVHQDGSLYADAGFREHELRNRLYLAGVLSHAGLESVPMTPTLAEHALGIARPGSDPVLKRRERKGRVEHRSGEELLLAYQEVSNAVDPQPLRDGLYRALRHEVAIHPRLMAELASLPAVPRRIEVRHQMPRRITVIELLGVSDADDPALEPTRVALGADPLSRLLDPARALPPAALRAPGGRMDPAAELAAGRTFSAMLAYIEQTLSFVQGDDDWVRANIARFNADRDVGRLQAALAPRDRAAAEASVTELMELRQVAGERVYLLKVFEANTRNRLGQTDQALALLHEALEAAPHLAGAWKDLGDLYFVRYQAQEAWRCWDRGRALAPGHPLLEDVSRFEARLVSAYPELF